eukprot:2390361-Amphidinium_carterae.1
MVPNRWSRAVPLVAKMDKCVSFLNGPSPHHGDSATVTWDWKRLPPARMYSSRELIVQAASDIGARLAPTPLNIRTR